MKTISTLFPIFYKGKSFCEKQNRSKKTASINRGEISKTVRKVLHRKKQIKILIKVIQLQELPALEIRVLRKKPFTHGCLLHKFLRRPWPHIFLWLTKTSREEMVIIAINNKGRKGKILLVNKEKMETMWVQGPGVNLGNQSKKKIEIILRQIFLLGQLEINRVLKRI